MRGRENRRSTLGRPLLYPLDSGPAHPVFLREPAQGNAFRALGPDHALLIERKSRRPPYTV